MTAVPKDTLKIFYIYAHQDNIYREQLDRHLSNLRRQYDLEIWFDRKISPGDNWEDILETHLNTADLIILLISPDFMDSDYCYSKEMAHALLRHERGDAKVLPVIVRYVHWKNAPFSHIQLLPTQARPIRSWPDLDEAFYDVVIGIERAIQELLIQQKIKKEQQEQQKRQAMISNIARTLERNFCHADLTMA